MEPLSITFLVMMSQTLEVIMGSSHYDDISTQPYIGIYDGFEVV